MLMPGLAIVLTIVLPWHVAVYAQHGWSYIRDFFFEENLMRYATTAMTPGGRGVWFYLPVLFGDLFPWAPLVLAPLIGVPRAWRRARAGSDETGGRALDRLLWIWIVLFVGIFSRMIPFQALVTQVPEPTRRGAFNAISASIQQVSGGVASLVAVFFLVSGLAVAPGLHSSGPAAGYYALPEISCSRRCWG
jgi:hypothetical protein